MDTIFVDKTKTFMQTKIRFHELCWACNEKENYVCENEHSTQVKQRPIKDIWLVIKNEYAHVYL